MDTEAMTEIEISLTEEQTEKVREATGMTVSRLKLKAVEGDYSKPLRPQVPSDCVVFI
jgi:hypothetical protein